MNSDTFRHVSAILEKCEHDIQQLLNYPVRLEILTDRAEDKEDFGLQHLEGNEVIRHISQALMIPVESVKSETRSAGPLDARRVIAKLLVDYYEMGFTEAGRLLNRDHSTIINAKRYADDLLETDENFQNKFKAALNAVQTNGKYGSDD